MAIQQRTFNFEVASAISGSGRTLLDIGRWVLILAATLYFVPACIIQGAPVSAMAFGLAAVALKFVLQPWRAFPQEFRIPAMVYSCAGLLLVGGGIGITLNFPKFAAREAEQARIDAADAAHKAAAEDARYHKVIAASVFDPLQPRGGLWSQLKANWSAVNNYRIQAAKLAVDQNSCSTVTASMPTQANPFTVVVTCADNKQYSFDENTISREGAGTEVDEDASSESPNPNVTDMATSQSLSKQQLEAILKDPDSVKYLNVSAYQKTVGDKTLFVFCGQLNAKNSFGAYAGTERFVATPVDAVLESAAPDFEQRWAYFCAGSGTSVWF
jgi:hypothetical protein